MWLVEQVREKRENENRESGTIMAFEES